MCGIIAIYSKNGVDARLDVPSALSSLSHRGPDGEGSWTCASKKAVLGHTRLSIMDPERGAQPMHLDHIHVAVNGEFYDFEEIRKELEQDGAKFTTDSDSEILLHLYRRYGIDCINRLSGEFSFVLWDENAGRIFAAQDRYGVKPLYYTVVDGSILFASEVKAIKALGTSLEWDEENVYNLAAGFVMDPRRTLFKNVYQVPAGHLMLASSGETRIQEYWNFNFDNDNIKKTSERESIELFDTALKTAVKRRLRADTPVGCYLSGGIDSSAVSAVASELHEQPVRAFTVSFADEMFDESRAAKQMAEKVGADYSAVHVTESDLADNYSKAIWHSEYVFANSHGVAKFLLSRHVQEQGYKVVLTGEGADEVLAGYPHFRQDLIQHTFSESEKEHLLEKLNRENIASKGLSVDSSLEKIPMLENTIGMTPSYLQVHINCNGSDLI